MNHLLEYTIFSNNSIRLILQLILKNGLFYALYSFEKIFENLNPTFKTRSKTNCVKEDE